MTSTPEVMAEIRALAPPPSSRRWTRRAAFAVPVAALALVAVLVVPTVVATPWAPVAHWGCQRGGLAAAANGYAPGVVANSPYGGRAWANGSVPWLAHGIVFSLVLENGQSGAVFVLTGFFVYRTHNVSLLGPGSNHRCLSRFMVVSGGPIGAPPSTVAVTLLPSGSLSDRGELSAAGLLPPGNVAAVQFHDEFRGANAGLVSSCASGPVNLALTGARFFGTMSFVIGGRAIPVPVALVVAEQFHYWMPSGFGTWQVDSTQADPGGAGAGLAFSYSACA